jgi:hypothetical protein
MNALVTLACIGTMLRNVGSPESIYGQIAFEDAAAIEWENRSPPHCTGRESGRINRVSGEITADGCALAASGRFLNAHIEVTCSLKPPMF